MKSIYFIVVVVITTFTYSCKTTAPATSQAGPEENTVRVMFYNVENLFDTINDPATNDEDFLPEGNYHWNSYRYHKKLKDIAKVTVNLGGWDVPAIIGLVEIENRAVLEDLVKKTPLYKFNYDIIHFDSPDERGIDVALLYRNEIFKPLETEPIKVRLNFPTDTVHLEADNTRDILYVSGTVGADTLHIFVNHWPSRRGGQEASEPKRVFAAQHLRTKVDKILAVQPQAKIVIMGDFNDFPNNRSIMQTLDASGDTINLTGSLYNPMYKMQQKGIGSYKYQQDWNVLDQMIISSGLLSAGEKLTVSPENIYIFQGEWLLEDDPRFPGKKPFRTYAGPNYLGGYSDHLPIFMDMKYIKN